MKTQQHIYIKTTNDFKTIIKFNEQFVKTQDQFNNAGNHYLRDYINHTRKIEEECKMILDEEIYNDNGDPIKFIGGVFIYDLKPEEVILLKDDIVDFKEQLENMSQMTADFTEQERELYDNAYRCFYYNLDEFNELLANNNIKRRVENRAQLYLLSKLLNDEINVM